MRVLTKEEIIFLNKNNVSKYGGNFVPPFNILHENPLDYLVEIVDGELFGEAIYPEVYHKAGVYLFNIISNHIFTDGNKRTGRTIPACASWWQTSLRPKRELSRAAAPGAQRRRRRPRPCMNEAQPLPALLYAQCRRGS